MTIIPFSKWTKHKSKMDSLPKLRTVMTYLQHKLPSCLLSYLYYRHKNEIYITKINPSRTKVCYNLMKEYNNYRH